MEVMSPGSGPSWQHCTAHIDFVSRPESQNLFEDQSQNGCESLFYKTGNNLHCSSRLKVTRSRKKGCINLHMALVYESTHFLFLPIRDMNTCFLINMCYVGLGLNDEAGFQLSHLLDSSSLVLISKSPASLWCSLIVYSSQGGGQERRVVRPQTSATHQF